MGPKAAAPYSEWILILLFLAVSHVYTSHGSGSYRLSRVLFFWVALSGTICFKGAVSPHGNTTVPSLPRRQIQQWVTRISKKDVKLFQTIQLQSKVKTTTIDSEAKTELQQLSLRFWPCENGREHTADLFSSVGKWVILVRFMPKCRSPARKATISVTVKQRE